MTLLPLTAAFLAIFGMASSCSEPLFPEPETMARTVFYSDVVLVGTPTKTLNSSRFDYDSTYDAEISVSCLYKVKENVTVPKILTVSGAGVIPGLCHHSNLTERRGDVIVFLRAEDDGTFEVSTMEEDANTENLQELAKVCETQLTYPEGVKAETAKVTCPKPTGPDACEKYELPKAPNIDLITVPPGGGDSAEVKSPDNAQGALVMSWSLVLVAGAIASSL